MAHVKFGQWSYEQDALTRQFAAATRRGRAAVQHEPQAQSVRYEQDTQQLRIVLTNGATCRIPCALIVELDKAAPEDVVAVELGPRGAALHWETLDVDVSLKGLLVRIFAPRGRVYKHKKSHKHASRA